MRTAQQRIAAYAARMQSSLIDPVLTAVNQQAVDNFTTYAIDWVPKQLAVRAILDAESVETFDIAKFEGFAGDMYAISRKYTGALAIQQAIAMFTKWNTRIQAGASAAILRDIAATVFNIVIP